MFPTAGYFRNVPCPFFIHGLCHRPYCHFRHAKQDTKGKSNANSSWTYGEVIENEEKETKASKEEDSLMRIIKNLSPGTKKDAETITKKSVTFPQFKDQIQNDSRSDDSKTRKCIKDELHPGESGSDPVPPAIVKEISELLQITRSTDESAKIAEEVKKRSRSKKGISDLKHEEKHEHEDTCVEEEGHGGENIIDQIKDEPKKPPKFSDINFFQSGKDNIPTKRKKRVKDKGETDSSSRELSEGSSSDPFDSSEATLQQIFDSYDPDAVNNGSRPNDAERKEKCILDSVTETTGVGSVKRRIAHNPNVEAIRQPVSKKGLTVRRPMKPSFVSPSLTPGQQVQASRQAPADTNTEEVSQMTSFVTSDGIYVGKKRKAHVMELKKEGQQEIRIAGNKASRNNPVEIPAKRPRIPVEFGSKVPQVIRQRYLDKIIDEYTAKFPSLQEVYDKAVDEEQQIFNRCSSRQIYMSLCVNAIKRIRELPNAVKDSISKSNETKKHLVKPMMDSYADVAAQLVSSITPSKTVIRPSTIPLAKTEKKHSSLLSCTQEVNRRRSSSYDISDLTESVFYEQVLRYLATDEERWNNNYPKESIDKAGVAVYKEIKGSLNPTKQNCARCGKPFQLNEDGEYINKVECHYHWGKLRRMRGMGGVITQFSCCQADAGTPGCSVAKLHVADYMGNLDGYVVTRPHTKTNTRKVFALDCEMCYTPHGLELTRVTIVDFNLSQVLDAFVKPDREVIDYNTRFSGVTEEDLRGVEIKMKDIHRKLLKKFGTDTILIGHSLESDLRALKLIHHKVVDTALVFPHRLGLPYKRALKTLMGEFLQKIIQDSDGGHDSYEDAAACMQLMKWKVLEDLKKEARKTEIHLR